MPRFGQHRVTVAALHREFGDKALRQHRAALALPGFTPRDLLGLEFGRNHRRAMGQFYTTARCQRLSLSGY